MAHQNREHMRTSEQSTWFSLFHEPKRQVCNKQCIKDCTQALVDVHMAVRLMASSETT